MPKKRGVGRPKLYSTLGEKKIRCFKLYDYEYMQMKKYYEMLKRERPMYYITEEEYYNESDNT